MKKLVGESVLFVLMDQVIKYFVKKTLLNVTIIPHFFFLTYTENEGAAWSILEGNRIFLILIGVFSLIIIYEYFLKGKKQTSFETLSYALLIGGIIGNLIDRVVRGYVIDYLNFHIFSYHYPIFNFADICIVLGVCFLIFQILRGEKDGNVSNR